ncbi:cilia- and flagella-associated protein 184 [Acanthopagrus schlegelii]
MEGEPENEENDVKNKTERGDSADISPLTVNGPESILAEIFASDPDEENNRSMKAAEEALVLKEAAISGPEENHGNELPSMDNITSEDLALKIEEDNKQLMCHEESVIFEINSSDDGEHHRLHLGTPQRENISPSELEEDKAEYKEPTAAPADNEDIIYEENIQLLQELCEERDKASQHSSQLQTKLAEYFRKKTGDDTLLERELPVSEQLQEYEKHINTLTELKKQLTTDSETAEQQAEELSSQAQEKLDKVENEWKAFVALKQDISVTLLSRGLGKQAAQTKVESALVAEQLHQDELIKLRHKNLKLKIRIHRLEAELRDREEHARDPLHLQFEKLQAERLELEKQAEKQNEEVFKMERKISSSLELLSNIKEKLLWSQMEVQAKREQLAEVQAMVARKRNLLTRTKQAHNSLQRYNLKLKECRGLLGNRVLLRDFEETVDASDLIEEQLENLKGQQAEILFSCGRWK